MYNHYIPQSDGSYRRSSMPEQPHMSQYNRPPIPTPKPPPQYSQPEPAPEPCEPPHTKSCGESLHHCPPVQMHPEQRGGTGIFSFLKGLLPREIDTDDLLIILLIMLMNRDEDCDGLSPMLTLALYFLL